MGLDEEFLGMLGVIAMVSRTRAERKPIGNAGSLLAQWRSSQFCELCTCLIYCCSQ